MAAVPLHKPLPARQQAEIERARLHAAAAEICRLQGVKAAFEALDAIKLKVAHEHRAVAASQGWVT